MVNEWSDKAGRFRTVLRRSPLANPRPFQISVLGRTEVTVLHLEKQAEKVVSSLIGANGPSAWRMDIGARLSGKDIEKGVVLAKTK